MDLKGQKEREFLKQAVRQTFENPKDSNGKPKPRRQLTVNQNRDNYDALAEEISAVAEKLATKKLREQAKVANFAVSPHQLRSLFTETKIGFRTYFVEACYLYAYGVERQLFLDNPENADLVNSWHEEKIEPVPPQYQVIQTPQILPFEPIKNEIVTTQTNLQPTTHRYKLWAMGLGIVAFISSVILIYKLNEWNTLQKDIYFLNLANNKTLQGELKQFIGVWVSYTGSPLIRKEPNLAKKAAKICWEFTDSGKGYLKIRRWRTGICDYGFAIMESTNIVSFHVCNQETTSLPRHSIIKLPTNGESKNLNCLSVGWSLGNALNEEIAIREVLERVCVGCEVTAAHSEGTDESRHFDLSLNNGNKLSAKYVDMDSLAIELRQLIDSSSMIRQYPNGG